MTNTIEIENLNISDLDIPTDETLQEVATACENIATSSEGIATSCENVATSCDSVATSCDNVATACGDIAKDTTLQSTNTALGSLATDATLQATNTALGMISGSLSGFATDTTLQSVKDSIDDLVTAEGTILNTTLGAVAKDTTLQSTNTALASLIADTTGQSIASAISGLGATLGSDKANISGDNIASPATFRQNIGLVAEEKTLAIAQGVTNITSKVMKYGNVVSIIATLQKVMVLNQYNRLATLPSDCLPPNTLRFYAVNGTKTTHIYTTISATSGVIEVEALPATADAAAQNIMIAISYITP